MMTVTKRILTLLFSVLPILSQGQERIKLMVHPNHVDSISKLFATNPNLSDFISLDSTTISISIFADNCRDPEIAADSIQFFFVNKSKSGYRDTSIIIKPDGSTSFNSYIFAFMVYEGAEIFEKPRKSKKPIHTVIESDTYDTLIFYKQHIDRKGQVWYYVRIKGIRFSMNHDTHKSDKLPFEVYGWMLKGRTRIHHYGDGGCY